MPAEKQQVVGGTRAALSSGLEHIDLRKALMAAPEDWRIAMEDQGVPSWHLLAGIAYRRAHEIGVNPSAWAQAQAALGIEGAAILVLIADANSIERGGSIRSAGGWVRRMCERAEAGQAHLHRSIYGLLHRAASTVP